jgi:uncharacterized protein
MMQENCEEEYGSHLERAIAAARVQQPVGSPCIDVCRLDSETGYCEGCLRSRDEIKAWRSMTDIEKLQLLDRLAARCT